MQRNTFTKQVLTIPRYNEHFELIIFPKIRYNEVFDIVNHLYTAPISLVPSPLVKSRFHCNVLLRRTDSHCVIMMRLVFSSLERYTQEILTETVLLSTTWSKQFKVEHSA